MPKFRFDFIEGMPEPAIFCHQAGRETKRAAKQTMLDGADPTRVGWRQFTTRRVISRHLGFQDLIAASENSEQSKQAEGPGVIGRAEARISIQPGQSNSIQAGA